MPVAAKKPYKKSPLEMELGQKNAPLREEPLPAGKVHSGQKGTSNRYQGDRKSVIFWKGKNRWKSADFSIFQKLQK